MVFIFVNEALSVILRSVHSVVNHTPAHLLKEIILVDDNSDSGKSFHSFINRIKNKQKNILIAILRLNFYLNILSYFVGFIQLRFHPIMVCLPS